MLVISPHLDDAVLSLGEHLAANPGALVVTVLAGVPEGDLPLTTFDANSGFRGAHEAVECRRDEDARAATVLDFTTLWLGHLDSQYGALRDHGAMLEDLAGVLAGANDLDVWAPLGLLHPDHTLVASLARQAMRSWQGPDATITAYEELPGRVLATGRQLEDAQKAMGREGWASVHMVEPVHGPGLRRKRAAIACYESQAWALDDAMLLVPERGWKVGPS